jgi:general secretion pathway protein H
MPTSVTGTDRAAGFTLVELMVVLVIMGLVATAVVLSLPDDDGAKLDREAGAFAVRLKRAQEEAVLTNRPVAVSVDAQGYGFQVYRRGAWTPLEEGPFQARSWGQGVSASLTAGAAGGVRFDPTGTAEPASVVLSQDGRSAEVAVSAEGRVSVHAPRG